MNEDFWMMTKRQLVHEAVKLRKDNAQIQAALSIALDFMKDVGHPALRREAFQKIKAARALREMEVDGE